jgi:hypothetical protein
MVKKSESDLCENFIGELPPNWTAYAETGGWDIVCTNGTIQVGIQAKLQCNIKVLSQCIERRWLNRGGRRATITGPHFRAALTPQPSSDFQNVASALGVVSLSIHDASIMDIYTPQHWAYIDVEQTVPLPEYVPDVKAGASSPLQLTPWKIKALKITALLRKQGYCTSKDFKRIGINSQRFTQMGWARWDKQRRHWLPGPLLEFDKQHPVVFAQIMGESDA